MADLLYANTDYSGGLASSYAPQSSYATRRRSTLDDALGIPVGSTTPKRRTSLDGALDDALYKPVESITPEVPTTTTNGTSVDNSTKIDKPEATGMSRGMANGLAGAQIGLGLLGFLENRKTSKLQREALRHDIDTAKEHRANRAALGASWNKAWGQ